MSIGSMTGADSKSRKPVRHLVLVLGDQLDLNASVLAGFDEENDRVFMAEVIEESTHVWSSKQRIVLFLSAMRHFYQELVLSGRKVWYSALEDPENLGTLAKELDRAIKDLQPEQLILTAPGDWRVLKSLTGIAHHHQLTLKLVDDAHFLTSVRDFRQFAEGKKQFRLEHWYRALRRRTGILMSGGEPVGGRWNYDADNRESFGKKGPPEIPMPFAEVPDHLTLEVIALVEKQFGDHPGSLDTFHWPVTRSSALLALQGFIEQRLPFFGSYQDAMWSEEPWLFHSHLSAALNLKLLSPREVMDAALMAFDQGQAPLSAVEGFIRQILGWREYVRGIYWTQMPAYLEKNFFEAKVPLPAFFWTGDTEMACLATVIRQSLALGYAHHIQRLMVTGLYTLLMGVDPKAVHAWYLSVYVDAVEWVELPNVMGMSQFADGGIMASKPYVATGKYIQRMSNYCAGCCYNPEQSVGPKACPFTTLYWDFLLRHEELLSTIPRMLLQLKNLDRWDDAARLAIQHQAEEYRMKVF